MIIVGDVPVGKSTFEKSLFDKKGFAYYQKLARIVHQENCRICAQLHQSDSNMLAMLKYVPGVLSKKITMQQLRTLLNNEVSPYITKMSQHKIHKIIQGFGEAAVLAVKADFDMVQVHGDRMCVCKKQWEQRYAGTRETICNGTAKTSGRCNAWGDPAVLFRKAQCNCGKLPENTAD